MSRVLVRSLQVFVLYTHRIRFLSEMIPKCMPQYAIPPPCSSLLAYPLLILPVVEWPGDRQSRWCAVHLSNTAITPPFVVLRHSRQLYSQYGRSKRAHLFLCIFQLCQHPDRVRVEFCVVPSLLLLNSLQLQLASWTRCHLIGEDTCRWRGQQA